MDNRSRSNEFGIHCRKKTGSWCIQDFACETSRVLTDVLVSWDRAAQLGKVAGASDLHRSSAPIKSHGSWGTGWTAGFPARLGYCTKPPSASLFMGLVFGHTCFIVRRRL